MKKYIVEISETAEQDLENIISYLKYSLAGDIIADKYKILFKKELIILLSIPWFLNLKTLLLISVGIWIASIPFLFGIKKSDIYESPMCNILFPLPISLNT